MAKAKTNQKPSKVSRRAAAIKVVVEFTGKSTLGEFAKVADDAVVAAGGKSNIKATSWYVRRALESAAAFGLGTIAKPSDIVVERAGN
jgi:hypothetical protein